MSETPTLKAIEEPVPETERLEICLPSLSLWALLAIRWSYGPGHRVQFVYLPRYATAMIRWLRVPRKLIVRVCGLGSGLRVVEYQRDSYHYGRPTQTLAAMKRVSLMMSRLEDEVAGSDWCHALNFAFQDRDSSVAYFFRSLPFLGIWKQVMAATVCLEGLPKDRSRLAWSARWSPSAMERITPLFPDNVAVLEWPAWYRWVVSRPHGFATTLLSGWQVLSALVRQGLRTDGSPRVAVSLATEYVEHATLGAWENEGAINRADILYFRSEAQTRLLRRDGADPQRQERNSAEDGFRTVTLSLLPFSSETISALFGAVRRMWKTSFRSTDAFLATCARQGIQDYLTLAPLFDNFRIGSVLHTVNLDGNTGIRIWSAAITALCRRHDTVSAGYQNRCLYEALYEDSFDCFDVYLSWGKRWPEVLGEGSRFFGDVMPIGCLSNARWPETRAEQCERITVSVFTSELGGNHFPEEDTVRFLRLCHQLAEENRNCDFLIKTKDPEAVDILLDRYGFRRLLGSSDASYELLRMSRHGCAPLIARSDIVLGVAYTTPGADALMQGKRVIFYSAFGETSKAFERIPNLVAHDGNGLRELFAMALDDFPSFAGSLGDSLDELDPFRDGKALDRVSALIKLFSVRSGYSRADDSQPNMSITSPMGRADG